MSSFRLLKFGGQTKRTRCHSKFAFTIMLAFQLGHLVAGDCCSDYPGYNGAQHIECPNINSPEDVTCVQNYLFTFNQMYQGTKPMDIYFTDCDITLFDDTFFDDFYTVGLQFNSCGLSEVPYRILGHLCSKLINGIRLNDNAISGLKPGGFANCTNLQILELINNKIVLMEDGTLDGLHPTTHNFAENPFYCNCSLQWFQDWLNENPSSSEGATCDEPVQGPVQYTEFCSDTTVPTGSTTAKTTEFQINTAAQIDHSNTNFKTKLKFEQ